MKKDAVRQGTMAISYEEHDVSMKVVFVRQLCICLVPPASYIKRIFQNPRMRGEGGLACIGKPDGSA